VTSVFRDKTGCPPEGRSMRSISSADGGVCPS
jgi:hypothetical protein